MDEYLTVLETDRKDLAVNLLRELLIRKEKQYGRTDTHLLSKTRPAILSLSSVNERRVFGIETMQPIRVLVHEGIVLRDELPTDFRGIDGRFVGHDDSADGAVNAKLKQSKSLLGQKNIPREPKTR